MPVKFGWGGHQEDLFGEMIVRLEVSGQFRDGKYERNLQQGAQRSGLREQAGETRISEIRLGIAEEVTSRACWSLGGNLTMRWQRQ